MKTSVPSFDYFRGKEAASFSFIRIPDLLIKDPVFKVLSVHAKMLYGIMLDRMSLSMKNEWFDEEGRVYIKCSLEYTMEALNVARATAVKIRKELEEFGLIEMHQLGNCKENIIFVKSFILSEVNSESKSKEPDDEGTVDSMSGVQNLNSMKFKNNTSGSSNFELQEVQKLNPNHTNYNHTDLNHTNQSIDPAVLSEDGCDAMNMSAHSQPSAIIQKQKDYEAYFDRSLEIEALVEEKPTEEGLIRDIHALLVDTCCSTKKEIRIGGEKKPAEMVKSCFMKLEMEHIRYVLHCLDEVRPDIRNIRQYLLTTLYNAPKTMESYYTTKVAHDWG